MRTVFLTYGDINFASSRMRAYWIAEGLEDAIVVPWSEALKNNMQVIGDDTKNVIMQKMADPTIAKQLRDRGIQVIWDVCDPVWWFDPMTSFDIYESVDRVIFSSSGLYDDFCLTHFGKVNEKVIRDRIKIKDGIVKSNTKKDNIKFIWFGFAQNRLSLLGLITALERLSANGYEFSLTIFDDMPDWKAFYIDGTEINYIKWSLENESSVLSDHDIALLPPYPGDWGKVKSNNKNLTALLNGLSVINDTEYKTIKLMVDNCLNGIGSGQGLTEFDDISESIREWKEILR